MDIWHTVWVQAGAAGLLFLGMATVIWVLWKAWSAERTGWNKALPDATLADARLATAIESLAKEMAAQREVLGQLSASQSGMAVTQDMLVKFLLSGRSK